MSKKCINVVKVCDVLGIGVIDLATQTIYCQVFVPFFITDPLLRFPLPHSFNPHSYISIGLQYIFTFVFLFLIGFLQIPG